ncbi:unknown [Bacteroides sp. CAG:20]|nr:unknown [Bacteroides sp. CAG:20]
MAINDYKGRAILKLQFRTIFYTNHFGSQHRKAHVTRLHNSLFIGHRIILRPDSTRNEKSQNT